MPENAIISDGAAPNPEAVPETAKEKFERERLSRRQALKKLGMTSAMATFALFSVDDLARMVGKAMQQRAGDSKVAEQVAKELQQAGVLLADSSSPVCQQCIDQWNADQHKALNDFIYCLENESKTIGIVRANANCDNAIYCPQMRDATKNYNDCLFNSCTRTVYDMNKQDLERNCVPNTDN